MSDFGRLVIDPTAREATAQEVLLEVGQLLARRGYMLQMGYNPTSHAKVMILARITGVGEALAVAEVDTLNPANIQFRLLAAGSLTQKADVQ
jgi:hypothetical protein